MRRRATLIGMVAFTVLVGACQNRVPGSPIVRPERFRIEGNAAVEENELIAAARTELLTLQSRDRIRADADDAAWAMRRHLRDEGYPDAEVGFRVEAPGVVFEVREGDRARIGRILFEGLESIPESEARPLFEYGGSGVLGLGPTWYRPAQVEASAASLDSLYVARGFYRVEIRDIRHTWNAARTAVDVTVPVEEGKRYLIGPVTIEGAEARYLVGAPKEGDPYQAGTAASVAATVRRALRMEGKLAAEVTAEADVNEETRRAAIHVVAKSGEPVHVGDVTFRGRQRTRLSFLHSRTRLNRGRLLRLRDLDRAVNRLYRTGLFKTIDEQLHPAGPGLADVEFDVEEGKSRLVDLEVGYGSWEFLRGAVTFQDLNLFGTGRLFRATGRASFRHVGVDLLAEDPWVLGEGWTVTGLLGLLRREERFYTWKGVTALLRVEKTIGREWRLQGGYRFTLEDPIEIDTDAPPEVIEIVEGLSRAAGLFTFVRWDRRDHLFVPTTGSLSEAGAFWSTPGLGANLSYIELFARTSWFLNLDRFGVLGFNVQGKTKRILDDRPTLPIQERYFLGGSESVRSFGQDELTPIDAAGNGTGGLWSFDAHVEWRKRLVEDLYGALFYDVGAVGDAPVEPDPAWGHGLGAGLRYYTPIGPVRLDVGWNPGSWWAAPRPWYVHFAFGFSF